MGWTINFGHPRAIPALLGLLAILFIPAPVVFFVVTLFGIGIGIEAGADARTGAGAGALIGVILGVVTFVLSIVAVCLISAKLSSRTS